MIAIKLKFLFLILFIMMIYYYYIDFGIITEGVRTRRNRPSFDNTGTASPTLTAGIRRLNLYKYCL